MKVFFLIIAFVSGIVLPIQAGVNIRLGKSVGSPLYASMLSFVVGVLTLLLYIGVTREKVTWEGIKTAPAYAWIGGALGAFFVTGTMLAFSRIGPALTFGLVVAGQMLIAVVFDHFNLMVAHQHSINIWRILGITMIIAGVFIIQKF